MDENIYVTVEGNCSYNQHVAGVFVDVIDLSYNVTVNNRKKYLLEHVNLSIEPGDMVCLMGPSGAGKSTLLDMIADRKLYGYWSGDIYVNKRVRLESFNKETAYVLQDDMHLSTLTVEETLFYAGWSRMAEGTKYDDIKARVDLLLEMMGLEHIRKSYIGDSLNKGISGGQIKRLSIAVEIITLPELIFLDSAIALEVMNAVMTLSHQNRTVMSTIHQPSAELFYLFNKVALMVAGRLVYFGSTNTVISHFTSPCFGYYYDEKRNPAEFIMDICGGKILPKESNEPMTSIQLEKHYLESDTFNHVNTPTYADARSLASTQSKCEKPSSSSQWTQFKMLLHRGWTAQLRDSGTLVALVLRNVFSGVFSGLIFFGQGNATEPLFSNNGATLSASAYSVCAILYFAISIVGFGNSAAIPYLCDQNILMQRELKAGAYQPTPNWLAAVLIPIIPQSIAHWVGIIPMYFLMGLTDSAEEFFYWGFLLLFLSEATYYLALLVASITKDIGWALSIFSFLLFFSNIFNGFFIQISSLPVFWTFAPYCSITRWAMDGVIVNYFGDYDTDDVSGYPSGNGNIISYFSFGLLSKGWFFLIYCAYISFNVFASRLFMVQEKRKIIKVDDASGDSDKLRKLTKTPNKVVVNQNKNSSPLRGLDGLGLSIKESLKLAEAFGAISSDRFGTMYIPPIMSSLKKQSHRSEKQEELIEDNNTPNETLNVDYFMNKSLKCKNISKNPCKLVFQNLLYFIPDSQQKGSFKQLLNGVTGIVEPGEMCALMGSSGAGKSTLLDVLAGRKNTGTIEGLILFNGQKRSSEIMKSVAYVLQDNIHLPILSVRESLYYAAELRLCQTLSKDEKAERVSDVMSILGLNHVADTVVGDENIRGLSGGQVKRLSIAVEIIHFPELMFFDEPTTGLDSTVSLEVMSAVKNLANQNKTILCTIHQPSAEIGALFQKLLLLANGRVIYFGVTNNAVSYFTESPYQFNYKAGTNSFDFVISVAGSYQNSYDSQTISGNELADYYSNHNINKDLNNQLNEFLISNPCKSSDRNDVFISVSYNTSSIHQLKTLISRSFLVLLKNYRNVIGEFIRYLFFGVFFAVVFVNQPGGTQTSAYQNRMSLFFITLQDLLFCHQDLIPNFIKYRLLFYRERGSGSYGVLPYWISFWIAIIPTLATQILMYDLIIYWIVGFRNEAKAFGIFYYFHLSNSLASMFTNMFLASFFPTTALALMISPAAFIFIILFCGYLVYVNQFPVWLSWGPYLSFMRWSYEGLVINEFKDNNNLPNGQMYLEHLGFSNDSITECALIVIAFIVGNALLSLLALKYMNFEKR